MHTVWYSHKCYHGEEHQHGDSSGIIRGPENPDRDVGSFLDPLGDGLSAEADSLDVHGVHLLRLALGREVHEHRR